MTRTNVFYGLCVAAALPATAGLTQDRTVYGNDDEKIASVANSGSAMGVPTMKIRLKGGQTNTLVFKPNGMLDVIVDTGNTTVAATYTVEGSKVCVDLPVRGRDCWPYDAMAAQGSTANIVSDRGQKIKATYMTAPAALVSSATGSAIAANNIVVSTGRGE